MTPLVETEKSINKNLVDHVLRFALLKMKINNELFLQFSYIRKIEMTSGFEQSSNVFSEDSRPSEEQQRLTVGYPQTVDGVPEQTQGTEFLTRL